MISANLTNDFTRQLQINQMELTGSIWMCNQLFNETNKLVILSLNDTSNKNWNQ